MKNEIWEITFEMWKSAFVIQEGSNSVLNQLSSYTGRINTKNEKWKNLKFTFEISHLIFEIVGVQSQEVPQTPRCPTNIKMSI